MIIRVLYVTNAGADQPVQSFSLTINFVIRSLKKNSKTYLQNLNNST